MKKTYKIIAINLIIVIMLLISTVIYAYYTNKKSIENKILLGYNEIEIVENYDPTIKLEKGKSFKKEICVKNNGNIDCYIRIKPIISDSRITNSIKIDYNLIDFTYNTNDGYYYYNEILSPEKLTKPLFTTVSINKDANDVILEDFDIYTLAEAVQTDQNRSMETIWNYFNK